MPYIKSDTGRREKLQQADTALNAGELNYQIFYYFKHTGKTCDINSEWCKEDIKQFVDNFLGESPNYQKYNDMTGCLIRCGLEIQRRLNMEADILVDILESYNKKINDYEDKKIFENGDVE